jgi:6-phosphogluconate dehydrogenase
LRSWRNQHYRDDMDRADQLEPRGIHYVDVGTSGGVFGLERGYCLMIGGEAATVARLDSLLRSIATGLPRRRERPSAREIR